jgi:hypothetical protein
MQGGCASRPFARPTPLAPAPTLNAPAPTVVLSKGCCSSRRPTRGTSTAERGSVSASLAQSQPSRHSAARAVRRPLAAGIPPTIRRTRVAAPTHGESTTARCIFTVRRLPNANAAPSESTAQGPACAPFRAGVTLAHQSAAAPPREGAATSRSGQNRTADRNRFRRHRCGNRTTPRVTVRIVTTMTKTRNGTSMGSRLSILPRVLAR